MKVFKILIFKKADFSSQIGKLYWFILILLWISNWQSNKDVFNYLILSNTGVQL